MKIPIIKVKDGNYEHIVGTNSHDVLYVDEESGGIQYLNMQCCEGTKKYSGRQSINFVGKNDESAMEPSRRIEFVSIEEMIEIAIKNMEEGTESRKRLHESTKQYLKAKGICAKVLEDDDIRDSSGLLLF